MSHPSAVPARPNPRLSHVARASLLIAFFFGVDKALGLLRQVIVGRQFGVSAELDAFNAANNIPDLLFALISGGALAVAFIPVLSETMERTGRGEAWALFSRVANLAFLLTGAAAALVAIFAVPIVRAEIGVAPGFTPELQDLVAELMRLDLVATLIFSISGLVIAGLQANQHFLLPALAPAVYDVGQIFGALVLAPEEPLHIGPLAFPAAGMGVQGLVYGSILGACLHLAVQVPGLIRYGFRWSPRVDWRDPGVQKVLRLMGPRILTIGAFQLIFVIQDNLASRVGIGSVTALTYGWLIMQVPETLIGTAVATALLPTIAEHFARGDDAAFEAVVARAVRVLLVFTIPVALLLGIALRPLVQLAFDFDARGTELVVWASRAYLAGLVGHSLLEVAARAFYARQNARLPMAAAALGMGVFIVASLVLYQPLEATGIALANSLAFTVEAVFLLILLARAFPATLRVGAHLLRAFLAAAIGGAACFLALALSPWNSMLTGVLSLIAGSVLCFPFLLPQVRELRSL